MADFVLIHGAWHGRWCWERLIPLLESAGHRVFAPSLTGLGDRAAALHPQINLETHIEDVASLIEDHRLSSVVLVAHSYAGMIGTAIADRKGELISRLIYVDAVVPLPHESWSSTHAQDTRNARLASARAHPQFAFPAPTDNVFALSDEDWAWAKPQFSDHPAGTYEQTLAFNPARVAKIPRLFIDCVSPPLPTIDVSRRRVRNRQCWEGAWGDPKQVQTLASGHDPMISAPRELANLLLSAL